MAEGGSADGGLGLLFRDLAAGSGTAGRWLVCQEPVAVLSVERYRRDPGSGEGLLEGAGLGPDMYDVSLSDGRCRLRATLRPSLNSLARRNLLHGGCELRGVRLGLEYDERRAGAGGRNFVIMEAQVVARGNGAPSPLLKGTRRTKLQVLGEGAEHRVGPELPLRARRRCYLPLWDCADYYGDVWHPRPADHPLVPTQRLRGSGSISLSQLEGYISQKRKDHPPVVVRILRKCRLHHFGRPDRFAECPFQAKFLAADKSGLVTLVLWNSLCMDWYRYLEPGMVIQLHNYVVKESYATRMGQDPGVTREPALELNLNPRNPAAEITVVSAGSVSEEWQLPPLQYCFATRKELSDLHPGDQCDIIGLVTFVGRQERIRNKEHADEFLVYRWVHLIDGTACEPFVLKLFSTCQPEIQAQVYPCSISDNTVTFLVCTNVRVEGKVIDPSGQTTFPYLLTTEYSQVYVNGYHQGKPYVKNSKVKEFIQWIQTAKDKERERLSRTRIGGCYSYPPLPSSERDYRCEMLGGSALTTMSELRQLLDQLEYREYRRVTVQGHISSVKYKSLTTEDGEEVLVFKSSGASCIGALASVGDSIDGNLSFQGTGRSRSPVIPVMRTSQRKRAALPPQNRKRRKGVTHRKRRVRPRPSKSTESSSEEEPFACLPHTGVKITEGGVSPDQELSFVRACQEFNIDSDEMGMTSSDAIPSSSQISGPWTSSPWQQEHLAHSGDVSKMVARNFRLRDKALLLRTFGLQPSKFTGVQADPGKKLEQCELACCRGYYIVTILGLNRELSLDTIFLPTIPRVDHRDMCSAKHDNTFISALAHGGLSSRRASCIDTDSEESSSQPPGDILRPVAGLEKMLFIFVLDICSQGGSRVEVALNRAYVQHQAL
ncbi:RPA-related protein RADX-like [Pristis pectinata]|uniref:RPA-related protein RADX-like n=1 Tax=Pristis pectinata TaxID=685728 RepID=UPI00223CFFF1|nr:RPA-related protein RADX-like [Pristis pectinata]